MEAYSKPKSIACAPGDGSTSFEATVLRIVYLCHRYLGLSRQEVWTAPPGVLLDLLECHWQHEDPNRPAQGVGDRTVTIDRVFG